MVALTQPAVVWRVAGPLLLRIAARRPGVDPSPAVGAPLRLAGVGGGTGYTILGSQCVLFVGTCVVS